LEAIVFNGPDRMLAAGATAEIPPGQQDRRPGRRRLIQLKIWIRRLTVIEITPVIKQKRPIAGSLNPLEELLGNDLIGINVRPIHAGNQAGVSGEGVHRKMSKVENQMS